MVGHAIVGLVCDSVTMADIQGIIDKYAEVCRELGATRSHLVMRVLKKEVKIQRK